MSKELPPNIQRFKTSLQAIGRSQHTVDAYVSDMRYFPDADDMTAEDIYDLLAQWQAEGLARKTIKRRLSALSAYYKYMIMTGKRLNNPALAINAQIPVGKPLPRSLTREQIGRIFAVLRRPRDLAMFMLCLEAGIRVSELVALNIDDLDLCHHYVMVRKGKGNKDRPAFFVEGAEQALRRYLPLRQPTHPKALFTTAFGRISVDTAKGLFRRKAAAAGVTASIHALKHSYGTLLVESGLDISFLQDLFDHASISTTKIYAQATRSKIHEAYNVAAAKAFGFARQEETPVDAFDADDAFAAILREEK